MPRQSRRHKALQNQAFLKALRRSGNARLAARELGVHRATFTRRRAKDPAFAAEWDAALALAQARLEKGDCSAAKRARQSEEPRIVRLANGRHQLRAPAARQLTRAHEQAFLAALSATANVRLAAAAAGFSHSAFYARRKSSPAFAREMRLALALGYDRIEAALLESANPESCRDDAWRHNDPPPIPQMTAPEALQLLHLHHKTARLGWSHYDYRKLRGIPRELRSAFLADRWQDRMARELENEAVAAVDESGPRSPHEPPAPMLPALDQVTGWSKADPAKAPHDPRKPMFGGWRIGDWKGRD